MAQKSEAEVREELKRLLKKIEDLKAQAQSQGAEYASPSEEQLLRKIRGETARSPFMTFAEWKGFTGPGGLAYYVMHYTNPDPVDTFAILTLFFGFAHLDPNVSSAVLARDARWPCVSTQIFVLPSGADGSARIDYTVPFDAKGTHLGTSVLWRPNPFDDGVGQLYDRSMLWVTLT